MVHFTKFIWLATAISLIGLASCNAGTPTSDPSLAFTQIWQTVAVAQTQTALVSSPTPSITYTVAVSPTLQVSNTPLLTSTPLPGSASVTPDTISSPVGTLPPPCDNYVLVSETFVDNSEVFPAAPFDKTWKIQNSGPCTWKSNYHLIWGWGGAGTNWDTTPATSFAASVLPGEQLDITVTLMAPAEAGTYQALFRLQTDNGVNFGLPLTVVVVVK
jgi:hypothetical protein